MIHYLRTKDNKSVVDAQTKGTHDFSVVVCIDQFGPLLLREAENVLDVSSIYTDFNDAQELRGAYFEGGHHKTMTADEFLAQELKKIGEKYGLVYITD